MADVSIDASVSTSTSRGMRSVVFATASIGYWFYIDSGGTFVYSKTTDSGATWGAAVTIAAATTHVAFDVWFDKWTPGDSGTLIHTWYFDTTNDDVIWRTLDTNGDSLGTARNVFVGASAVAGNNAYVSGTKTRSGYLYCISAIDASNEQYFGRSTDSGTTWSAALSATFEEANPDHALLFPASNTGDDNDCWAVYHDSSIPELTMKMWDSSAAAQVESSAVQANIAVGTDITTYQYPYTGAIRHSDGHLILVSMSSRDLATTDMQVWDVSAVNAGSLVGITAKTNITTNIDDNYHPAVFVDQNTDNIYVAYNGKRDGSETLGTTTKVYYTKSTDGGATWSAGDTAYMENVAGVVVQVWAPLSGTRFYAGWRIGTTLLGGATNSVAMTAITRNFSDSALNELDDFGLGFNLLFTDNSANLSDAIAKSAGALATLSDNALSLADAYAQILPGVLVFSDNAANTLDALQIGNGFIFSDSVVLSDANQIGNGLIFSDNAANLADSHAHLISVLVTAAENILNLNDVIALRAALNLAPSENFLNLADSINLLAELRSSISETILNLNDARALALTQLVLIAESFSIDDQIQLLGAMLAVFTDNAANQTDAASVSLSGGGAIEAVVTASWRLH